MNFALVKRFLTGKTGTCQILGNKKSVPFHEPINPCSLIQKIIKVFTLGFFVTTLTTFVVYRMGYFDASSPSSALQTSPNGGELNNANQAPDSKQIVDSIQSPEIKQQTEPQIMPSSKSAVPLFDLDEYKRNNPSSIMPSTKVMLHPIEIKTSKGPVPMVLPKSELENPFVNSTNKEVPAFDLEKLEQKKENELRMSSSKSMVLSDPKLVNFLLSEEERPLIKPKPRIELTEEQIRMYSSKSATTLFTIESLEKVIPEKYRREFFKIDNENEPKKPELTTSVSDEIEEIEIDGAKRVADSKTNITTINWRLIGIGVLGILFVGIGSIVYFKRKSK